MNYKIITKCLILALMVNAAVVFCILDSGKTCWDLIVLYWFLLTAKNYFDWRSTK